MWEAAETPGPIFSQLTIAVSLHSTATLLVVPNVASDVAKPAEIGGSVKSGYALFSLTW